MSVKGQLIGCRDALLAGMRASARAAVPNPRAETLLRACLDLVEHLAAQSLEVKTAEVETTLAVLERALGELEDPTGAPNPVTVSLRNSIGRLRALRIEIESK
jgi:hypothetical protein